VTVSSGRSRQAGLAAVGGRWCPRADPNCSPTTVRLLAAIGVPWWFSGGPNCPFLQASFFALDGVLLGAGDAAFMRNLPPWSGRTGRLFLPFDLAVAGVRLGGLAGIWSGP